MMAMSATGRVTQRYVCYVVACASLGSVPRDGDGDGDDDDGD